MCGAVQTQTDVSHKFLAFNRLFGSAKLIDEYLYLKLDCIIFNETYTYPMPVIMAFAWIY